MTSKAPTSTTIPGRSCGECLLCCKLAKIVGLDKPDGVWCRHCAPGRGGCTIYETRPPVCRNLELQLDFGAGTRPRVAAADLQNDPGLRKRRKAIVRPRRSGLRRLLAAGALLQPAQALCARPSTPISRSSTSGNGRSSCCLTRMSISATWRSAIRFGSGSKTFRRAKPGTRPAFRPTCRPIRQPTG